jgi:hypothetical protein
VWRDHIIRREQLDDDLEEWLSDNADSDVYFCPHGLIHPKREARNAYEASHLLWADLDAVDPTTLPVKPTIAWRTSRGRYSALWTLDGEPSHALRKGFNAAIGADRGWHYAKVLRVPGSTNHKYSPPQRGKVLWDDGPVHELVRIARIAGNVLDDQVEKPGIAPDIKVLDPKKVAAKYAGKFDIDLMHTCVVGDRSDVIWKLGQQLKKAGASRNEIGTLIYYSPSWQSKHGRNSLGRLAKEVDRVLRK